MEITRKMIAQNGSVYLSLSKPVAEFLKVKPGDEVVIKDHEDGQRRYISVWKKTR